MVNRTGSVFSVNRGKRPDSEKISSRGRETTGRKESEEEMT